MFSELGFWHAEIKGKAGMLGDTLSPFKAFIILTSFLF
jgi:hypothetical protein